MDGEFVVFLVGMRLNRPWAIWRWLPQVRAMLGMIRELSSDPSSGFLGAKPWFGRTILVLQYWKSTEHLIAYANNPKSKHRPAWQAFYKGVDGSVGFWHETYSAHPGSYESVNVDMPPFGLGAAGKLIQAESGFKTAASRIKTVKEGA